jgi:carboxyl-terminal processing protease
MRSAGRVLLLIGTVAAIILAVLGIHHAVRNRESEARLALLNGVWRSRGYGWLWTIEGGRVRVFDESGPYCIARPDVRQPLDDLDDGFDLRADRRLLRVSLGDPAYRFTFDRIDALPEACARPADASPSAVIDALGHIFPAHYAFFKARHVDWPALIAAAKERVTANMSQADLLHEMGTLLAHVDDDHVTMVADIGGERFECDPGQAKLFRSGSTALCPKQTEEDGAVARLQKAVLERQDEDELLGSTAHTTANGNIRYGLIGGDIGYLGLLSMEDFDVGDADETALNDALDDAMALFAGAKAVIVDVSLNDGGEDTLARATAARFAAKRTLAYSKFAGDAPGAVPQAIYVEPSSRPRFTGTVFLLTSNVTVSAAEIFTMAMRALPNVTHFGERTRGCLSDVLGKRLPNGWLVTLSNEIYLDADGKAWEGTGIEPTVPMQVFKDLAGAPASHAQALRQLIERIRGAHI